MNACRCFNDSEIGVLREADWEVVVCNRKFWMILRRREEMGDGRLDISSMGHFI